MSDKCPKCGADKNTELSNLNHYAIYKCGSDELGFQSALCRIRELETEREQWVVNWCNAADYDLCRDLAYGRPIAPSTDSVSGKLLAKIELLEAENAALRADKDKLVNIAADYLDHPCMSGLQSLRSAIDAAKETK